MADAAGLGGGGEAAGGFGRGRAAPDLAAGNIGRGDAGDAAGAVAWGAALGGAGLGECSGAPTGEELLEARDQAADAQAEEDEEEGVGALAVRRVGGDGAEAVEEGGEAGGAGRHCC